MRPPFYETLAQFYDHMIPWEKRLAAERPAFEALWRRFATRRVLDAACGSGAHLQLFLEQGLDAAGADASPAMLARAHELFAALPPAKRPPLAHCAWEALPECFPQPFDAVLCLGNSLPHALDPMERAAALAGLWACVAPGGFLLIQFKNFARLRARGERLLPLTTHVDADSGDETLFVRTYCWHEHHVDFQVIVLNREPASASHGWRAREASTPLAALTPESVESPLRRAGAAVERHGSLRLEPFAPDDSEDVVILARREG